MSGGELNGGRRKEGGEMQVSSGE